MNELKNEVNEVMTAEIVMRELTVNELESVNGGDSGCNQCHCPAMQFN